MRRLANMRIGGYGRNVLYAGNGLEAVVITWPPGTRTPKHDHSSGGWVWVLKGRIFEVEDGRKRYFNDGDELAEVALQTVHIVGNDSDEEAVTFHVYKPELSMTLYPDADADLVLCNSASRGTVDVVALAPPAEAGRFNQKPDDVMAGHPQNRGQVSHCRVIDLTIFLTKAGRAGYIDDGTLWQLKT